MAASELPLLLGRSVAAAAVVQNFPYQEKWGWEEAREEQHAFSPTGYQ